MSTLLQVHNVETKYYGRLTVLRGVSLAVEEGQIVAVLGSNGAGKTTLLRTIMGYIPDQPEKGTIEVLGRRVNGWDPEDVARLGVAYIPEGRGIFSELTVEENLALGAYTRRDGAVPADLERVRQMFPVIGERHGQCHKQADRQLRTVWDAMTRMDSGEEMRQIAIGRHRECGPADTDHQRQ